MNTKMLRQAIKAGDAAAVAELLKSGLDTEIRLTAGWTPLHIAVKAGKQNVVAALVNGGAEVNATTELYRTALDIARDGEKKEIADFLRKKGARSGAELSLHGAAIAGDLKAIKKHLKEGADINHVVGGVLPLCIALQYRKWEAGALLLRKKCDVTKRQQWNVTPLHVAVSAGAPEQLLDKMLKLGAGIEAQNDSVETPLCSAAGAGIPHAVEWLISHGAYVQHGRLGEMTPVYCALQSGHTEIASRLIDLGAKSTLHQAVQCNHLARAREKLNAGADPNKETDSFQTESPLKLAVWNDWPEMAALLLEFGADPNQQDRAFRSEGRNYGGDAALHLAVYKGSAKMVKLLLANGADPDVSNAEGLSPIQLSELRSAFHLAKLMEAHIDKQLSLKATESGIEQLYTIPKIANLLSVEEEFVQNLIKTRALTSIKLDEKTIRVPAGSVERYLLKMQLRQ